MNKKSWLIVGLSLAMAASIGVGLSACGGKEHKHNYDAWDHNETQHWKYCDEHGEDKSNIDESTKADHDFTNGDCVCGMKKPEEHTHNYTQWKKDVIGYQCWKVCPDDNAIDPANGKALHTFNTSGTCTRCGAELADMIDIYLSASTKLPTEAFLDSVIINQRTKSDAAPNNPHLTLDVATKTYSITMWLTKGEIWKPWAADQLDTDGVYDLFNWLYRYDETAKAQRSVDNISLASGQESGVYTVSWVYNAEKFTMTAVDDHEHTYDGDTDEVCNTCGYVRHFYKSEWTQTPTEHYYESTCEHEGLKKDYGLHDYGGDNVCDTCGYTKTSDYTLTFEASGDAAYVVSGYTFLDPSVTKIAIPATYEEKPVIGIKDDAFYKDKDTTFAKITEVELPDSLVTLGKDAFRGFTALATINLDKITSYGEYALSGTAITTITLPDSLTVIPAGLFSGCAALTTVNLGNAVTELGAYAFSGTGLTSFTIPATVTTLGNYLFSSSKMQSFTFVGMNEAITKVPTSMFQGSELASVEFGDKITAIGPTAFTSCEKLTTVTIPTQLKQIHYNAFKNAGLTSVTFDIGDTGWKLGTSVTASSASSISKITVAMLTSGNVSTTVKGGPTKPYFCHE